MSGLGRLRPLPHPAPLSSLGATQWSLKPVGRKLKEEDLPSTTPSQQPSLN